MSKSESKPWAGDETSENQLVKTIFSILTLNRRRYGKIAQSCKSETLWATFSQLVHGLDPHCLGPVGGGVFNWR